jgi:hypothetical protein
VEPAAPAPDRPADAPPARETTVKGSLNELFGTAPDPAPLPGRPSTPAPNELSLDHVFRNATPAAGGQAQSSTFSFDQFFSQQAHQDVSATESESGSEASGGASDDIQQFNAWLEGLKKT